MSWIMWVIAIAGFVIQLLGFIPFYFIYKKDCREIGKDNLAVSLSERFVSWCLFVPFWLIGLTVAFG